jgi:hypothetical protein
VQGTLLAAAISPDNTPHGYNLTFAFPMLLFIIVAVALYLRFRSPHRVPGHAALASSRQARRGGGTAASAASGQAGPVSSETTHGSTLHEGTQESSAQESAAEQTPEEGE